MIEKNKMVTYSLIIFFLALSAFVLVKWRLGQKTSGNGTKVYCRIDRGDGTWEYKWVDARTLKPGSIRHESLPESMIQRVKIVHHDLAEVDASSLEEWIGDFKRDAHPEKELLIWEKIRRIYVSYTATRKFSLEEKKEIFRVIVTGTGAPLEEAVRQVHCVCLTETEIRDILRKMSEESE